MRVRNLLFNVHSPNRYQNHNKITTMKQTIIRIEVLRTFYLLGSAT